MSDTEQMETESPKSDTESPETESTEATTTSNKMDMALDDIVAMKPRRGGFGQGFTSGSSKLSISNLQSGVSDNDLKELFTEFGDIKSVAVHYNSTGTSLGTAHVEFKNTQDAHKAIKKYNGVQLDGKPMRIAMEGGMAGRLSQNMTKRLGGRGGGRGRGRGGRRERPEPKTAEELDAELDAYLNSKNKAEDLDAELDEYSKSKGEAAAAADAEAEK